MNNELNDLYNIKNADFYEVSNEYPFQIEGYCTGLHYSRRNRIKVKTKVQALIKRYRLFSESENPENPVPKKLQKCMDIINEKYPEELL